MNALERKALAEISGFIQQTEEQLTGDKPNPKEALHKVRQAKYWANAMMQAHDEKEKQ